VPILGIGLCACDKSSQPDSTAQANTTNTTPSAPNTSAADDQTRDPLPLVSLPLVVSVPHSWTVDPPVSPMYLKGPAPNGNLRISLSMLEAMDAHLRDTYIAGADQQAIAHPQRIQVREVTSKAGMKVLERRTFTIGSGIPSTQLAAATKPSDTISWDVVLFVPYHDKFIPCRLDLFELTQDQYRDDEQFLDSIVDSAEPGKFPGAQ
jgi:hypothetical protein